MTNLDQIFGLKPVSRLDGQPISVVTGYKSTGTTVTNDLFPGDPLALSGTAGAPVGYEGSYPGVTKATEGDGNPVFAVMTSIELLTSHLDRPGWVDGADEALIKMVVADGMTVFLAQADEALAVTDVGNNANFVQTQAGSRVTGCSGVEIDATVANTVTYQFKIIGFPQTVDNEIGAANNKVLVVCNNPQLLVDNIGV